MNQQEYHDEFYRKHGRCCAGCDHWAWFNGVAGECMISKAVPGTQRLGVFGISNVSAPMPAGHIVTPRDYHCGRFKDTYDWLPWKGPRR